MDYRIDLNADLGEGKANDNALLKYVSSCNIACGGHTGNRSSIKKTIQLAQKHKVKIGVHPAYPDVKNFGRNSIDISIVDLVTSIHEQLILFKECIDRTNAQWHHIKFHGALYNDLKNDETKAKALVDLIKENYPDVVLYVPPNSIVKSIAEPQISIKTEGFADRAYNENLSLVSRKKSNALLTTSDQMINQVKNIVINQLVETTSSKQVAIHVDTICIHGDTPQALELVKRLVDELQNLKIEIV